RTIVASPDLSVYINPTVNCGMATAGTGDVLRGIIASFIAQGLEPLNAALLGVYIHGLAGDLARDEKGEHGLIASDLIEKIPSAILNITGC
ncbi:MAG: NAD(P)H-hydrate dehydratase, partial [Candidatus Firestonebacteria bacterium]